MTLRALELQLRRAVDSVWGAMFGALVYAAWAVFANWDAGAHAALIIGATHWFVSTFLTYTGTGVMRHCYAPATHRSEAMVFAFIGGLSYTYALLLAAHFMAGTPHLLLTLAAGIIPNVLFCSSYALLLSRTQAIAHPAIEMPAIRATPTVHLESAAP